MSTTSWPAGPIPLHVGADHPALLALTLVLAFGPFVLLGVVIWRRRRAEAAEGAEGPARDDVPQRER